LAHKEGGTQLDTSPSREVSQRLGTLLQGWKYRIISKEYGNLTLQNDKLPYRGYAQCHYSLMAPSS